MHRWLALLLAMTIFVTATSALPTAPETSQVVAGKRSLRVQAKPTANDDSEERGVLIKATLRLKLTPWSSKAYPYNVLDKLVPDGVHPDEKTMFAWFNYVLKYRKARGKNNFFASDSALFYRMASKLSNDDIALLLLSMSKQPKLASLSKELQPKLFNRMLFYDVTSEHLKAVLGVKTQGKTAAEVLNDPAYLFWQSYVSLLRPTID